MTLAAAGDQASRLRALVQRLERPQTLRLVQGDRDDRNESADLVEPSIGRAPVLAIASGKGGVGKTSIAVNVSIALARRGLRVTLVDADLGLANADLLCGLMPQRRLEQAMRSGGPSLDQLSVRAPGGFRLVPGAVGVAALADLEESARRRLLGRLGEIDGGCDAMILDTSAGIGAGVLGLCAASTMTLVVATPEPTSVTDAYALLKCLSSAPRTPVTGVLVNQAEDAAEGGAVARRLEAVAARFLSERPRVAGWVCHDTEFGRSIRARSPLVLRKPGRRSSRQLDALAGWLTQELRLDRRAAQRLRRGRPRVRSRVLDEADARLAPTVRLPAQGNP
ncbi:MAG: P-loop NTPase [Planctomycetota bacterium]